MATSFSLTIAYTYLAAKAAVNISELFTAAFIIRLQSPHTLSLHSVKYSQPPQFDVGNQPASKLLASSLNYFLVILFPFKLAMRARLLMWRAFLISPP